MTEEADAAEITVEVRLSDELLARRILEWLERTEGFAAGAAAGNRAVMVADHIPDDTSSPVVLLASEDELLALPRDRRVAARLHPDSGLVKFRIAIEAAAYGLSVTEAKRKTGPDSGEAAVLTARELEVLRYIAAGASNKVIARSLGISSHTVKFHVGAILQKLGASTRTEAATQALRLGMFIA